jgi:hypothetical protein
MGLFMKKLSSESILCLKEALVHIYWRKKDIRTFIYHTIKNNAIVTTIDWENSTKEVSVSVLIDRMVHRYDIYENDLFALFDTVSHFNTFSHLEKWEDGPLKVKNAKDAVAALKKQASGYFQLKEEEERAKQRKEAFERMQKDKDCARDKQKTIKERFLNVSSIANPANRGFAFEKFLSDLFEYYDLDPRRSFKIEGEQIDGAFTFENTDYLVEAKWQQELINNGDLHKFAGKISNKLKTTMGLFISFNGFSPNVDSAGIKSMILMDGADLMAVLDERIDLNELLQRKRRHASETGNIYFRINDILKNI